MQSQPPFSLAWAIIFRCILCAVWHLYLDLSSSDQITRDAFKCWVWTGLCSPDRVMLCEGDKLGKILELFATQLCSRGLQANIDPRSIFILWYNMMLKVHVQLTDSPLLCQYYIHTSILGLGLSLVYLCYRFGRSSGGLRRDNVSSWGYHTVLLDYK